MLEYIFFDERPCEKFNDFLKERGLQPSLKTSHGEWVAALPEGLDDKLIEEIESYYDEMMEYNEALMSADDDKHVYAAAVEVRLADGRKIMASVRPELLKRVLGVLSFEELGEFVDDIASAVENPDDRPICRR